MKHILTWQDIEEEATRLAEQLKDKQFDGILAVTKGGMIPAALLAKKLDINFIETVGVKSYTENNEQSRIQVIKMTDYPNRNWLVIDDLVDSGKTFEFLRERLPNATFAVLYAKPAGEPLTDYYSKLVEQDVWLCLPWEN